MPLPKCIGPLSLSDNETIATVAQMGSSGFVFDEKEGPKQSSELDTFDQNSVRIGKSKSRKVKNARPGKRHIPQN